VCSSDLIADSTDGFDILRLVSPQIEDFNTDFYCEICKSKYCCFMSNTYRDR
jgi:hypothetical protein